jgi:periplasmic glucans biosynthesis protein
MSMTTRRVQSGGYLGSVHALSFLFFFLQTATGSQPKAPQSTFTFDRLVLEAQERAQRVYRPPDTNLPSAFRDLNYDGYRAINYRRDRALWGNESSRFWVEFYLRGYLFRRHKEIFVVDADKAVQIPFSPSFFEYTGSPIKPDQVPDDLGFSGFRLLYPINRPDRHDEFISFLGTNYFRAIGRDGMYGVSARGLAIDLGVPTESFPYFAKFWIEKPSPSAGRINVFALLDDPNAAGAYRFVIEPGSETVVEVEANVFARTNLRNVGLAPMTSMFFYGPNGPRRLDEDRPQVHDSDGLLIAESSGSWTWRPLWNPDAVSLSRLQIDSIRGFGLMQRDRDPNHYRADTGAAFQQRPSVWVEPMEAWNGGTIRLSELPSQGEGQDNIAACWIPPGNVQEEKSIRIRYRLHFGSTAPAGHDVGQVVKTRWFEMPEGRTRFNVDFGSVDKTGVDPAHAPIGVATATNGQVSPAQVQADPNGAYWRVAFDLTPDKGKVAELRAHLESEGKRLTEVWSFAWPR